MHNLQRGYLLPAHSAVCLPAPFYARQGVAVIVNATRPSCSTCDTSKPLVCWLLLTLLLTLPQPAAARHCCQTAHSSGAAWLNSAVRRMQACRTALLSARQERCASRGS
jgi:hypothetical protein